MGDPSEDNPNPDSGSSGQDTSGAARFLSGKTKRDAVEGASPPKRERSVNPRTIWSAEARARQSARIKDIWAKKHGKTIPEGTPEEILEVKGEPAPKPPASKPSKEDVEGWSGLIYLGHVLGAAMLKVPELGISKSEADQLSIASMNVMRHYSATILSEKSQDWIKFAMVAGAVYIPRMTVAKARVKAARDAKKAGTVPPGQNPLGGFERAPSPDEIHAEETETVQ